MDTRCEVQCGMVENSTNVYYRVCVCVGVFPHYFKSMFHTTPCQIDNGSEVVSSDYQCFGHVFFLKFADKLTFQPDIMIK